MNKNINKDRPINEIFCKYNNAGRDKLIPVLQEVQEKQGYISKESILEISRQLNIPASKIYGVASFYNQFRFQPKGKYEIQICRGTACHVQGSVKILDALKTELKIESGETTRDGLFTLEVVACIGACGLAPVISINGEFYAQVTPEKIRKILNKYREMEKNNDNK
jgi:NADH-quinone oxidoreductase subunit E